MHVTDYEKLDSDIIKSPDNWHFQFRKAKKILITGDYEKTFLVYGVVKTLVKRGKPRKTLFLKPARITDVRPWTALKGSMASNQKVNFLRTKFSNKKVSN